MMNQGGHDWIRIPLLEGEAWYGGAVTDGPCLPYSSAHPFERDLRVNGTNNQAAPLLLSNRGRHIQGDHGFHFRFENGDIRIRPGDSPVDLQAAGACLKDAYLAASAQSFPPSGRMPDPLFFRIPQYNTWIEFMYDQNQAGIERYAESILREGYPQGLLMIDCGWNEYYGSFRFHAGRFPDPVGLIRRLHGLGFKVMLWTCPFISPDSVVFRDLRDRGLLLRDCSGDIAIRRWWDGYSAVLDLTCPDAQEWLDGQHRELMSQYGIDGFKLDAGDAEYYRDDDRTCLPTTANGQCEAYARFGLRYSYNEFRACWKMGGYPLVQRLADKQHTWDRWGLGALVPSGLAQGLIGHPFTCPDMIGGGDYLSFRARSDSLDPELFVRYAQCAALFPMMQFSAAPWRVLDKTHADLCLEAARIHLSHSDRILRLAEEAARTGLPILRSMELVFPGQGFERVLDQYLLGEDLLVAPVLQPGARMRTVRLPDGIWMDEEGAVHEGGRSVVVPAPLHRLPRFFRS